METVLFYSAGPYGPLGRQLATRAAHELCRNATALHVERSLAQTMAASWRASAGAIVLLGGANQAWPPAAELELEGGALHSAVARAGAVMLQREVPPHVNVAAAKLARDLGKPEVGAPLLESALAIYEREYGSDSTEVAGVLNDLGNAYGALGDLAKSIDVLERALAIKERAYGRDHTEVAATLRNLGNAYRGLGDSAKTRDLLERVVRRVDLVEQQGLLLVERLGYPVRVVTEYDTSELYTRLRDKAFDFNMEVWRNVKAKIDAYDEYIGSTDYASLHDLGSIGYDGREGWYLSLIHI